MDRLGEPGYPERDWLGGLGVEGGGVWRRSWAAALRRVSAGASERARSVSAVIAAMRAWAAMSCSRSAARRAIASRADRASGRWISSRSWVGVRLWNPASWQRPREPSRKSRSRLWAGGGHGVLGFAGGGGGASCAASWSASASQSYAVNLLMRVIMSDAGARHKGRWAEVREVARAGGFWGRLCRSEGAGARIGLGLDARRHDSGDGLVRCLCAWGAPRAAGAAGGGTVGRGRTGCGGATARPQGASCPGGKHGEHHAPLARRVEAPWGGVGPAAVVPRPARRARRARAASTGSTTRRGRGGWWHRGASGRVEHGRGVARPAGEHRRAAWRRVGAPGSRELPHPSATTGGFFD